MPYKFSVCMCLQHPERDKALAFYRDILGLPVVTETSEEAELDAAPFRLFLDDREPREWIMELIVPDLEAAREELVAAGCSVERWEGKGKVCYIRDPFGQLYNIWEESEAFSQEA